MRAFDVQRTQIYAHLLASENELLLCWRNAFLFFDSLFDPHDLCKRPSWRLTLSVESTSSSISAVSKCQLGVHPHKQHVPLPVSVLTLISMVVA